MPKKPYEVTLVRTGILTVFADSPDEAMAIADRQNAAYVRWDDGISPTDAREVESDGSDWDIPGPAPAVIGAWNLGDIAWFLLNGKIAAGLVKSISLREGTDGLADLRVMSYDGPATDVVPGMERKSFRLLFRTRTELERAITERKE